MLTTATPRAWAGHAAQGIVGGYDHGHRHHLLGEEDGAGGSHRRKLGMTRAVALPPPPISNEGAEEGRKRKKQERLTSEAGEADRWGTVEGDAKAGKGDELSSLAVCPPSRQLCFNCGTSRTPMWRKGPAGPKSLCNACGIRYRKLKRAGGPPSTLAATAPAAASGGDRPKGNTRASPGMPLSLKLPAAAEGVEEKKLRRRQRRRQEVLCRLLEESRKFELPCGKEAVEAAVLLMAMSSGLFIRSC